MAAVAANKGIQMPKIEVQVTPQIEETQEGMSTRFVSTIDIGEGLTRRERTILYNSARRCEVHKLLSGKIEFIDKLAD